MLEELKEKVFKANLDLVKHGLVLFTWGNASAIDDNREHIVIKPSGVDYDSMKPSDMVVVRMSDGQAIEGGLKPSSDTPTHLELYRHFDGVGGVVHTHSTYATAWAQAGVDIPILGTTQADYFYGDVPCTRSMTAEEIENGYEKKTGSVIIERFEELKPLEVPGVITKNHGPFAWGKDVDYAVYHAVVLEEIAKMAFIAKQVNPAATMNNHLTEKHYQRKHGADAYYGQC